MRVVSRDFLLNCWILAVAIFLAMTFVLPAFAEEESSGSGWEWVRELAMQILPDVITDTVGAIVSSVLAGLFAVLIGLIFGHKNYRKKIRHKKMAEIYERLLAALYAEIDAYDTLCKRIDTLSPEAERMERLEKEKVEKAKEEWSRAISAAELHFPSKSVNVLRERRKQIDEAILKLQAEWTTEFLVMSERSSLLDQLAEEVKKQAEKDIGKRG